MNTRTSAVGKRALLSLLTLGIPLAFAACATSGAPANPAQDPGGTPAAPGMPTIASASSASLPAGTRVWVLASDGNQASYRVREQLANRSFPSDAVGTTTSVTGKLSLGADGQPLPRASQFSVDLTNLRSDSGGRDRYVRQNTLQSDQFPSAVFNPKAVQGLASPLPTSGKVTFQMSGDLTIHGVTKPATWDVTAQINGQDITGTAMTTFSFSDFGMQAPRAFVVLSVEDKIQLEYDFHLVPAS